MEGGDSPTKKVAGMRQSQRQKLRAEDIQTIEQLAALPAGSSVKGLSGEALHELRQQAELQLTPVDANGRPAYRLRPFVAGKGLGALPAADFGDIWFDMEGIHDPVGGSKLEYLFGACYRNTPEGEPLFKAFWAHSEAEEKRAFEAWVDWVEARASTHLRHPTRCQRRDNTTGEDPRRHAAVMQQGRNGGHESLVLEHPLRTPVPQIVQLHPLSPTSNFPGCL